jgi:hypothetical protein
LEGLIIRTKSSVSVEFEFVDIEAKWGIAIGWFEIDDLKLHAEREFGPVFDAFEIDIAGGERSLLLPKCSGTAGRYSQPVRNSSIRPPSHPSRRRGR